MIRQSTRRRALIKAVALAERTLVRHVVDKVDTSMVLMWFAVASGISYTLIGVHEFFPPLLVVSLIVASIGILVPMIVLGTDWVVKKVKRPRIIGNRSFPVELYWKICEVLEQRGINDVQKYFDEHPAHNRALTQLVYGGPPKALKEWTGIVALVYLTDEDPEGTRAAITSLIEERGDMPAREYRALLEIREETASALTGGTL